MWRLKSIPNMFEGHNQICFTSGRVKIITFSTGNYEMDHLASELKPMCAKENIEFSLTSNENTLKTTIQSNWGINFKKTEENTIFRYLLDFNADFYTKDKDCEDKSIVNIIAINSNKIEHSIATGSYHNGQLDHTLHEFFPEVPSIYKIIERPSQVIYFPLTAVRTIDKIEFRLVVQKSRLVDFQGEEISLRVC